MAIKLKSRIGTRVVVNANPASRMLYRDLPPNGTEGEVTNVAGPRGRMSYMPGPGGGLVYIQFDNGQFMGVSPRDLDYANRRSAGDLKSRIIRLASDLPKGNPTRRKILSLLHHEGGRAYVGYKRTYSTEAYFKNAERTDKAGGGVPKGSEIWRVNGRIGIFPLTGTTYRFSSLFYLPPRSTRPYLLEWESAVSSLGDSWLMNAMEELIDAQPSKVISILRDLSE